MYAELRSKLLALSQDPALRDEEFLTKCIGIGREAELARQREIEDAERTIYLYNLRHFRRRIVWRAWTRLVVEPLDVQVPFDVVEAAYDDLVREGTGVWFPRMVYLEKFGDPVPCGFGFYCPHHNDTELYKKFDGVMYAHYLGDFEDVYCSVCRNNDCDKGLVHLGLANEVVDEFLDSVKHQSWEALSAEVRALLFGWIGEPSPSTT